MRPLLQLFAASTCAVLLSAWAGAAPSIREPGPSPYPTRAVDWPGEGVIRVFGWMRSHRESFWRERQQTQGAWVLAGDSLLGNWRSWRRDLAPRLVANRAIGGEVSRGLLFRFQEDVLDLDPSGIVLLIGGNDLSALQPTDQTVRNIERMLEAVRAKDASLPIILCTLPPRNSVTAPTEHSELMKLNASIKQLAATRNNVIVLELFPLFATPDAQPQLFLFTNDRLHLSAAGYSILSKAVNAQLESVSRQYNDE